MGRWNSGKTMLGSNFVSEVNRYFGKSDNFPGNFMNRFRYLL